MTCHVCANPTCVNDCQHFPPPALKVGSAEQKLQELLKIANDLVEYHTIDSLDFYYPSCFHCGERETEHGLSHDAGCPILKLEQFKQALK